MQCILVCGVNSSVSYNLGNVSGGSQSNNIAGELRYALVLCGDVRGLGSADGVIGLVSTQIVICACYIGNPNTKFGIAGKYAGGLIGDRYANLACRILIDVDVHLGRAVLEVHTEATLNSLKVYVGRLIGLIGGCQVVAAHVACKVEILAQLGLIQCILVCGIDCRLLNLYGHVQVGGCGVDQHGEGLSLGLSAALDGQGNGNGSILLGEGNGQLTAVDNSTSVVGGPGVSNLGIGGTCQRKLNNGIIGDAIGQNNVAKLHLDLLAVGALGQLAVIESICADGDQIEVTVVKLNDTADKGVVAELLGVQLLEGLLLFLGDAVVGRGDTDIGLQITQFELVVTAGGVLTGDLNVTHVNKHGLSAGQRRVVQRGRIQHRIGIVHGNHDLNTGLFYDGNGCINDLIQAVISILRAGDLNGHTDLQTKICLGILAILQTVDVITALALHILDVDTVAAGSVGLGEDTGNDTLDSHNSVVLGSSVIGIAEFLICGNLAGEGLLHRLTALALNGSGQRVGDLGFCLFVDVDCEETVLLARLDGNTVGHIDSPLNGVSDTVNHNAADYVKIGRGLLRVVLIQAEQVIACESKVITLLCHIVLLLAACSKHGKTKGQTHEKRNQFFHNVSLIF